jgi:hypothetical protein
MKAQMLKVFNFITIGKTKRKNAIVNKSVKCHSCSKLTKGDYLQCQSSHCENIYCSKCLNKYEETFDACFECKRICKCPKCEQGISNKGNIVKIDDFVIMEGEEEDIEEEELNNEVLNAQSYELDQVSYNKMLSIVKNVEGYKPHGGKINRICIMCNKDRIFDCGVMKFKTFEEFMLYLKYFYRQKGVYNNDEYKKSYESFYKTFNEYMKNQISDYNFKSIKFVCRECMFSILKEENGFNNIYNALHVGLNNFNKKKLKDENSDSANNISNNDSEKRRSSQMVKIASEKSNLAVDTGNKAKTEGNVIESPTNSDATSNKAKLDSAVRVDNLGVNLQGNNTILGYNYGTNPMNSNNNLTNLLTPNVNPELSINSTQQQPDSEKINNNISSLINTFEQNRNLNMHSMMEELKKQFFSIQYYSLLQKLFISYVFKNLEIFLDQIGQSQTLGERLLNGMLTTVPKTEGMDQNSAKFFQTISDQLINLKTINKFGYDLTNDLNNNFEQLKNNGIRLFKSMDPNLNNTIVNNTQNLINESGISTNSGNNSEVMKNLSNIMGQGVNNPNLDSFISNMINKKQNLSQPVFQQAINNRAMNQHNIGGLGGFGGPGASPMNFMLFEQMINSKNQKPVGMGFQMPFMPQNNNILMNQNNTMQNNNSANQASQSLLGSQLTNNPNLMLNSSLLSQNPNLMGQGLLNQQSTSGNMGNMGMHPLQFSGLNQLSQLSQLNNQLSQSFPGNNYMPMPMSMPMSFGSQQMNGLMNNLDINSQNSQQGMFSQIMNGQMNPFMTNPLLMQQMNMGNNMSYGNEQYMTQSNMINQGARGFDKQATNEPENCEMVLFIFNFRM